MVLAYLLTMNHSLLATAQKVRGHNKNTKDAWINHRQAKKERKAQNNNLARRTNMLKVQI